MITDFQHSNLIKLRDYVATKAQAEHFDMYDFFVPGEASATDCSPSKLTEDVYHTCGTSCCLAGHGPLAGVKPLKYESWPMYTYRVFAGGGDDAASSTWSFLFSANQSNDISNAIKRLDYVIQHRQAPPKKEWNANGFIEADYRPF